MPKPSEKYRGEDRTLEAIRERADKLPLHPENSFNWDQACDELAAEMKAEGLNTTAAIILSHKINR